MHDPITRGGFVSPIHRAAVMAAYDNLRAGPAEPAGGDFEVGRSSVHAGASEGCGWASNAVPPECYDALLLSGSLTVLNNDGPQVGHAVRNIYDLAQRIMASAGPMPLAGTEPWVEGDVAYRTRLSRICGSTAFTCLPSLLDPAGSVLGLPRARLVPVER